MQFFIADNEAGQMGTLRTRLEAIDKAADILPKPPRAIMSWVEVESELLRTTEDSPELVVILDLGLEPQDMAAVGTGVERAYQLRSLRPNAVFIAYTQFGIKAEHERYFRETFDGRIDKQQMHSVETFDEQVTYVRQILIASIRKRRKLAPRYKLRDSIGLRLAAAAFGEDGIDYLVEEVARGWEQIQVSALSSGHSGAFLLAIEGVQEAGLQRIIVKCGRERRTIENDTRLVQEHLSELGPLGGCMAQSEQVLHELPDGCGYYYRQAEVMGETLYTVLAGQKWGDQSRALLDTVLRLELRCYERGEAPPYGKARASDLFPLKPLDTGRAKESLRLLENTGRHCAQLGQWPEKTPSSGDIVRALDAMIDTWGNKLEGLADLFVVGQHGDLNLGNILVPSDDTVVLIDFSRLGRWPVGYDVARLATMCRIKLTDADEDRHWVENRLRIWTCRHFCEIDKDADVDHAPCPSAVLCDKRFAEFLAASSPTSIPTITLGYKLGTLWDLIKILSYSDLPIFKRLWALVESWRLASQLGFLH